MEKKNSKLEQQAHSHPNKAILDNITLVNGTLSVNQTNPVGLEIINSTLYLTDNFGRYKVTLTKV